MSRWIRVQTSIFEHELFAAAEFSQREAWLWLIANVAWKETRHRVGNEVLAVPVGSMFITLRALQSAWRWKSDKRVRSFLSMLETERMIDLKTDAGKTQVSICNYSRYQDIGRNEDASGTQRGRSADAQKTPIHQDTSNTSSVPSDVCPAPAAAAPASPTVFELPALQGKSVAISQADVADWSESFPAVDIRQQLAAMRAWLNANPKNGKTTSGMKRFVVSWLTREQNRGGSTMQPRGQPPQQARPPDLADLFNERARQLQENDHDGCTIEGSYDSRDFGGARQALQGLAATQGQPGRTGRVLPHRLPQGDETRDRHGCGEADPGRAGKALEVIRAVAGGIIVRDP